MMFYEDILREFNKHKVKYILAGGVAVNIHGYLRSTGDLDILVEMSEENLRKIVKVLKNKGYHVKQPVDPILIADRKSREDWIKNKNLKAFNFYKESEMKEVDILLQTPVSYSDAKKDMLCVKADSLDIPVISLKNLIKMKRNTGRQKDREDIKELTAIDKLKKTRDE